MLKIVILLRHVKLRKKYIPILLGINAIGKIVDIFGDKRESPLDIDKYFHGSIP
jgi:hypothetical protein